MFLCSQEQKYKVKLYPLKKKNWNITWHKYSDPLLWHLHIQFWYISCDPPWKGLHLHWSPVVFDYNDLIQRWRTAQRSLWLNFRDAVRRWRQFQKANHHCSPPSVREQRHKKDSRPWEIRFSARMRPGQSGMCGENQDLLNTCQHHPYSEMWRWSIMLWAVSQRLVDIEGEMKEAKQRDFLEETFFQRAQGLRLGQRFTFQQDTDPKLNTLCRPARNSFSCTSFWLHFSVRRHSK